MTLSRRTNFRIGERLHSFAAFSWCDQSTPAVVGGKDAVVAGEIDSGLWYQSRQSGDEIHDGWPPRSNATWVVPSR